MPVTLVATDDDGGVSLTAIAIQTVVNLPPTLSGAVFSPNPINEGSPTNLSFAIADPGFLDTYTVVIDWGDGSIQTIFNMGPGPNNVGHNYINNIPGNPISNYTISMTATDDDGASSTVLTAVETVLNAPPKVNSLGLTSSTVNENDVATLTGVLIDPGVLDTFTLFINWADGTGQTFLNLSSGPFTYTHRYLNNVIGNPVSNFTIHTTLTDNDGAVDTGSVDRRYRGRRGSGAAYPWRLIDAGVRADFVIRDVRRPRHFGHL